MLCLVDRLLLILHKFTSLCLELNRSLPLLEVFRLLDAISSDDSTISEFAESADAGLERTQLAAESFQEPLDLSSDNMSRNFPDIVEADLNDSFGLAEAVDNWIVQNMLELLVCDRPDLSRVKRLPAMVSLRVQN